MVHSPLVTTEKCKQVNSGLNECSGMLRIHHKNGLMSRIWFNHSGSLSVICYIPIWTSDSPRMDQDEPGGRLRAPLRWILEHFQSKNIVAIKKTLAENTVAI